MLALFALFGLSCSSAYEVRLSDGKSVSRGPLFFFGWADPPLLAGTRLVDAREGQRLVLWDESGLEAIVDVGDPCAVLVREGDGARAPTALELAAISAVFPNWPLAAAPHPELYLEERRLARRFPSHIRAYFERLDPAAAMEFALGDAPAGWLALGGRAFALVSAAQIARSQDLARVLDRVVALEGDDRRVALRAILERAEINDGHLLEIVKAGEVALAVSHKAANERVCLAALEVVRNEPLSSARRRGLEAILGSKGVTARVRERVLEVPLAYPEDREAVRKKADVPPR